jgi:hypothetical protein
MDVQTAQEIRCFGHSATTVAQAHAASRTHPRRQNGVTQPSPNEQPKPPQRRAPPKSSREQDAAEAKRSRTSWPLKREQQSVANQLRNEVASVSSERDSAVQQRDAYAAALAAVVKARIESVPGDKRAAVRKLVPDTLPLDQQLTQVEAAIELVGTTAPAPRGTGSNPPRAGSSDERAQRIEENKRQIRSAYSL